MQAHEPPSRRPPATPVAAPAWRCPACGAANRAYAAFCLGCGEPTPDEALPAGGEAEAGPRSRRLLQLGAILLAGMVLAWVLVNWYADEAHATSYRQGTAAAAAHDWSRAAAQYHAAGTFADAAARAAQAEANLRDLAQLAHAAEYAGAARNWPELLALLDRLLQIDPSDTGAQAQRTYARNMILDEGLAGTLYLVAAGPRAGLYLNLPGARDVQLPGSDGRSRPRALSASGDRLVYDRPRHDPGASPLAAETRREAVLAVFGRPPGAPPGARFAPIGIQVLPPAISPGLSGDFVPGGLFWKTYSPDDGRSEGSLIYYRFADGHTFSVQAGEPWRYIAAAGPATGTFLRVEPPGLGQQAVLSLLTIGQADAPPILDMHLAGWLTAAAFSADGRYLLYTMQDGSSATSLSTSLYVVDLPPATAGSAGRAIVHFLQSITSAGPRPPTLTAEFVPAAAGTARQMLVTLTDGTEQSLTLVRLADGLNSTVWTGAAPRRAGVHALSDDGAWLAYMAEEGDGTRLVLQGLGAATPPLALAGAGFRGGDTSLQFAPGARYLVYRAPGPALGTTSALYSLALPRSDMSPSGTPRLHPVYLGTAAADAPEPAVALAPGGDLLLYRDSQGAGHAVAYDGTLDLPLTLPGPVAGVWSLQR